MQKIIIYIYKGLRRFKIILINFVNNIICKIIFYLNNVSHENFHSNGLPYIMVALGGSFTIGKNFRMNNNISSNPIGCAQTCNFFVDRGARLIIGDDVNISQAALICHQKIVIGNKVKLGGGVCIYDTDFHSLNPDERRNNGSDEMNRAKKAVIIKENAFIGAHSIILKGVVIGKNSIVGARSVVTKSIPENEIWGGNPAKKIKSLF